MDHGRILETGSVKELAAIVGDGDIVTLKGSFTAVELKTLLDAKEITLLSTADQNATLSLNQGGMTITDLLGTCSTAGVDVTDISLQKPSLESVFLKLTGRELRD
jgi:ABC-2 type transport system ATP-binding protein